MRADDEKNGASALRESSLSRLLRERWEAKQLFLFCLKRGSGCFCSHSADLSTISLHLTSILTEDLEHLGHTNRATVSERFCSRSAPPDIASLAHFSSVFLESTVTE